MQDKLKCALKLEGSGKSLSIPCGNIAKVHAAIHSHGYEGAIEFWIDGEEEVDFLYELPIILATLTLSSHSAPEAIKPLEVQGVVTHKALIRESCNREGSALNVLSRAFYIQFKDPLQAMWSQHFPSEIFTNKTLADVLNTYLPSKVKLKIESEVLQQSRPSIALGLGGPHNRASFYSFVMWYLHETNQVWEYDYQDQSYRIGDKKKEGAAVDLPFDEGEVVVNFPEPARQDIRVINSYVHNPATHKTPGSEVYEKVSRDTLIAAPLQKEFEAEITKTKPLPHALEHRLEIYFAHFPIINFLPSECITFNDSHWSGQRFFKKKTYRITSFFLDVQADNLELGQKMIKEEQVYSGQFQASLELKEEAIIQYPSFVAPYYPFTFEGEIFSSVGGEKDFTFDIGKDKDTQQMYYTVELPAANKQHVTAPFEPTYVQGQSYFPLGKKQRVLLAFDLFTVKIVSVLEWLIPAGLPIEVQGNRIVFTPKKDDKVFTIMEHREEDGHLLFFIHRKSDPQSQIIRLEEEQIVITVQKEGEEVPQCLLSMDNNHTITISSQDVQAKQTQTVMLMPKQVSLLCEEGGDKSSIVMTPTSITIESKAFTLNTDQTDLKSKEKTTCKGKTIGLEGSQGINIEDAASVKLNGKTMDIKGSTTTVSGKTISIG